MAENLGRWLTDIGLGSRVELLLANDIDWDVLPDLTDQDLKDLGLSLGERKRLLKAIATVHAPVPGPAPAGSGIQTTARPSVPAPGDAERRQVTVMFVDVVESTPLSERLDPEDLREVLRAFHEACARAIEAEDGHIARYMGDGILVYFGYPRAHEDDAARAVRAGLGIIEAMRTANDRLEEQYKVRLKARIGIHTGLAVVGEVGAGSTRDREAIVGETPNIAARVQAEAQPDTVVVGDSTWRLVEAQFRFEDLGARPLKGVSHPVRLYRVISDRDAVDRFAARTRRGMTPLVGRDAELEMLRRRWAQACDHEMRCVLLVGEPGIGKSRVLRAFREGLAGQPHETITLYCSPYHTSSAFAPLIEWLCRALGLNPRGDPEVAIATLDNAAANLGLKSETITPTIAALLGVPATGPHQAIDAAAALFNHRVVVALTAVIGALARRQPLAMFVEDAHWIDPSTQELLRALLEQLATQRLLLLVTARPEFRPDWNHPQFVQLNLDRLSRRDRAEMVELLTAGKKLPAFVLDQIVSRTDGIPLFVEELTRTVLEGGLLRDAGGHYELSGPFEGIAIPDTLHGSLLARLDRLDPDAKEVAQIGAAIGRQFDRELVALVADRPGLQLDAALAQLVAAEIVQPASSSALGGTAYGFRHALIQDAAYQSLLLARRRHYHAAIARAITEHFPESAAALPEVIAQHLTAADQLDNAIDAWLRAGECASRRGAYTEALAHLDRGLALVRRLPVDEATRLRRALSLQLARGQVEIRTMRVESLSTFRDVARIARQEQLPDLLADAAMYFSEAQQLVYSVTGESVSLLEGALAVVGDNETATRCRLLSRMGRTLLLLGQTGRALEVMQTARLMAQRLDDRRSQFDILTSELLPNGSAPLQASGFHDRRSTIGRVRRLCDEGGAHEITYAEPLMAHALLEMGDSDGALQATTSVEKVVEISGAPGAKWMISVMRAMRAILHGDFAAAERLSAEALEFMNDPGFDPSQGIHGMQMFTIRREQGRLGEVASLIRRFVDEHPEDATWRPGLMLIASELGFADQARKHFDLMATSGFALPDDSKRTLTLVYLSEVCARLGDADRARQLLALLMPWRDLAIVVPPITLCLGSVARFLGMLAATIGDWPAAEGHFEAALAMDERMKAWPWLAHTRFEYSRALLARGRAQDRTRAQELRSMALAAAERLGMGGLCRRAARADVAG